jgi:membrane protease subunit (stomatin/prohibitin family)
MKCCVCGREDGTVVFGNDQEPFCPDCQAEFYMCMDCGYVGDMPAAGDQEFCPECRSIDHKLLEDVK